MNKITASCDYWRELVKHVPPPPGAFGSSDKIMSFDSEIIKNIGVPSPLPYRREDLQPYRKPIYDAPLEERLADLKRTIESVENMLAFKDMVRPYLDNNESLKVGEFAIGDWIIRPRFA